jgi:hypothetical protein
VAEIDQRARRLVIAYAILLDAIERGDLSETEPCDALECDRPSKTERSHAPEWLWVTCYAITVCFCSISLALLMMYVH